jgi:Mn-dependent DtxR family transcriptional regulator
MKKTTEDYLKTIYKIKQLSGEVRSVAIAEALSVSKPTVSNKVKHLIKEGYITMDGSHCIELTEKGLAVARATLDRNRTIRELLEGLGVDEKTAEADACEMEHAISHKSMDALKKLAGRHCLMTCAINAEGE